jgi:ATP-dependent helicase YprA (DUF1998 family)
MNRARIRWHVLLGPQGARRSHPPRSGHCVILAAVPPRILRSNVKQLDLLLTRQIDVERFSNSRPDFLTLVEAHTFTGAPVTEMAYLMHRPHSFVG